MIAVAHRAPRAIVCCVSAPAIHELTDEMPASVQIAVPKRSHRPMIAYPPVTVFRFEEATLLEHAEALGTFGPMRAAFDVASAR